MVAAREVGSAVGSAAAVRVAVGTCAHHEKSSEKGLCMAMPMGLCVKGLSMLSEFDCCENSRRTMVNLPTQPIKNTHISVSAIRNICDRGACGPTNERSFLQYDRTAVPCIGVAVCLYLVDRERFVTRGSELTVAATSLLLSYAAAWLAVALRLQHS